jgi:hypothetical protein
MSADFPFFDDIMNLVWQHRSMQPPKQVGPSTTANGAGAGSFNPFNVPERSMMLTVGVQPPPKMGT